jgi:fucose permease
MAAAAFALLGTGLAAGFPTMLGIVGNRYPDISGTAFSFVMAVALIGNILVNYSMGQVAKNYGIRYLTTFTFVELAVLVILALFIFRKVKQNNKKS